MRITFTNDIVKLPLQFVWSSIICCSLIYSNIILPAYLIIQKDSIHLAELPFEHSEEKEEKLENTPEKDKEKEKEKDIFFNHPFLRLSSPLDVLHYNKKLKIPYSTPVRDKQDPPPEPIS